MIRDYLKSDKESILLLHDEFMKEFFPEFHSDDSFQEESDLESKYSYFVGQQGKFWVFHKRNPF